MKSALPASIAAVLLAGCVAQVPTDPNAFNIKPEQLAHLPRGQEIALLNGHPEGAKASVRVRSLNTGVTSAPGSSINGSWRRRRSPC